MYKPVAAKNEAMNPSRKISKEILDTPVTEAIKYLFFNKKKNKDIVMNIKKSTFDYSPSLIEYEGNTIRINFILTKKEGGIVPPSIVYSTKLSRLICTCFTSVRVL